jgi:hypothetical protein
VEALLLMLNSIAVLIVAYMGLRDDRRPPGTPQTSLFRTFDYDAVTPSDDHAQQRQDWNARTHIR